MAVAFLSLAAWSCLVIMSLWNPSQTLAIVPLTPSAWIFLGSGTVASFLLPVAALRAGRKKGPSSAGAFFAVFAVTFTAAQGLAWIAAEWLHRDFFSFVTQSIVIYIIIFLIRIDDIAIISRKQPVYRALYGGALTLFLLWFGWLMMMAYAVVTRAEPRWIESTAYNAVNAGLGLLLLFSAGSLWDQSRRTLRIQDGRISLEDRDISSLLSPQENQYATIFLTDNGVAVNCRRLVEELDLAGAKGTSMDLDCTACIAEQWKASNCGAYRNIKNRINDTKKYLELLQIGTIVPVSENPRDIKEAGWRFRFFDDVRIEPGKESRKGNRSLFRLLRR